MARAALPLPLTTIASTLDSAPQQRRAPSLAPAGFVLVLRGRAAARSRQRSARLRTARQPCAPSCMEGQQQHASPLEGLHVSVLEHILSFLDARSLGAAGATCHTLRAIARTLAVELTVRRGLLVPSCARTPPPNTHTRRPLPSCSSGPRARHAARPAQPPGHAAAHLPARAPPLPARSVRPPDAGGRAHPAAGLAPGLAHSAQRAVARGRQFAHARAAAPGHHHAAAHEVRGRGGWGAEGRACEGAHARPRRRVRSGGAAAAAGGLTCRGWT